MSANVGSFNRLDFGKVGETETGELDGIMH
jgi:hypothetical protein